MIIGLYLWKVYFLVSSVFRGHLGGIWGPFAQKPPIRGQPPK